MADAANQTASTAQGAKRPARRTTKPRPSLLEKLTPEELLTLRLPEDALAEFHVLAERFARSRAELQAFEDEDVASMDDARYDQRSAAEAEQHSSGMAVVHFMAPRILRLREGPARRKWRSFLTKFRKDEKLG